MCWFRPTLSFLLLLGLIQTADAQSPFDGEMDVRMDVVRVADLQATAIDFGTVLINGDSGSVVMDRQGSLRFSGGVIQTQGFPQVGELIIDADNGVTASISFDPVIDMGGGVQFRPQASRTLVNLHGTPEKILIFGEMLFPMATQSGTHTGLLAITVTYN